MLWLRKFSSDVLIHKILLPVIVEWSKATRFRLRQCREFCHVFICIVDLRVITASIFFVVMLLKTECFKAFGPVSIGAPIGDLEANAMVHSSGRILYIAAIQK